MKTITWPQAEIPVVAETEVLVVGGGPAGFGAALTAARMGRKTMLIEQNGAVGRRSNRRHYESLDRSSGGRRVCELREKARDCECPEVINRKN